MGAAFNNPSGTTDGQRQPAEVLVERLFRRISEVSSLPIVAMRIIEVANDQSAGAEDLLEAVRIDAAMATRIMRTVNSSYYSLQNKVADLKLAITLLGFKEIRNLAMTAYVSQLFKQGPGHGSYSREGLWNHLIGVGAATQLIAQVSGKVPPQEAYLAGLLHDLGTILIDQYLHKPFCKILDRLDQQTPICQIEQETLGFDHAELGEFVAVQWHVPEHLTASIRYHHDPLGYDGTHREMVYAVNLANFFCHAKGLTCLGVVQKQVPPAEIFTRLGLDKPRIGSIWEQLDETLLAADIKSMDRAG